MNTASAMKYNGNVKILPELITHLSTYWPKNRADDDFALVTERFQKAKKLEADGYFGPATQLALKEEINKPKPANYIIVDGIRHAVDFKVITWEQDSFWSAYNSGNFRWRTMEVNAFVLHWDVTPSAKSTHIALCRPNRDASVHFYGGEDGTIYQCLDAGFVRAWHAGSNGKINSRSIGIEINNPYYEKNNSKTNPRKMIKDKPVNKNVSANYLDFHEVQKKSVLALSEALVKVESISIPKQLPKNTNCKSHWLGDDKDPKGSILRGELSPEDIGTFAGVLGHLHFEEAKIDPGIALFEYFVSHGW